MGEVFVGWLPIQIRLCLAAVAFLHAGSCSPNDVCTLIGRLLVPSGLRPQPSCCMERLLAAPSLPPSVQHWHISLSKHPCLPGGVRCSPPAFPSNHFHHCLNTFLGENLFLFYLFQQLVISVNSRCFFSALYGTKFVCTLHKYLSSQWMDVCMGDCFGAASIIHFLLWDSRTSYNHILKPI